MIWKPQDTRHVRRAGESGAPCINYVAFQSAKGLFLRHECSHLLILMASNFSFTRKRSQRQRKETISMAQSRERKVPGRLFCSFFQPWRKLIHFHFDARSCFLSPRGKGEINHGSILSLVPYTISERSRAFSTLSKYLGDPMTQRDLRKKITPILCSLILQGMAEALYYQKVMKVCQL